jgi:UV excision repair protein RAD23
LVNEKTVEECGIKESDFLVLMVSSSISAAKPKTESTKTESTKSESTKTETVKSETVTSTTTNTPTTATQPAFTPNEEAVNSICEMGFPREEVIRALKASFNNPDRAVEYLTNGIPEGTEAEEDEEDAVNNPQFMQLRMVVQQDPRLLGPLLEQIAQGNPEIFELIKENQEAFMELIQAPLSDAELQLVAQSVEGEAGEGDEEDGDQGVDPTNVIQVTEEEQAAIERLMALGFDRPRVIEAYFACDKNETIAANFLFEHMDDEDF